MGLNVKVRMREKRGEVRAYMAQFLFLLELLSLLE